MKCIDRNCNRDAVAKISKKQDLSHRTAEYCAEHAEPFKRYPEFFQVKFITKETRV